MDDAEKEESSESMEESMSESDSDSMSDEGEHQDEAMTESEDMDMDEDSDDADDMAAAVDRPAWQLMPLTDARTGETFTIADFAGQTVFVEPMATWCGNCRRQLTNVNDAKQQLASDDVVFIALSVETNLSDGDLASYADGEGFDLTFAVLSPDLLRELAGVFGQTVSNPPSTPHFIVRPDGTTTELVTGIEPAGDIISQIAAIQG
jgi:thiol-disulfide isomerase/thioredoxin